MDLKEFAANRLKQAILAQLPKPGMRQICQEGVFVVRRNVAGLSEHRFDRPLASLLVQGAKTTMIGGRNYEIAENQLLTVAMDMPSASVLLDASKDKPLLTMFFYLDTHIISELLLEMGDSGETRKTVENGVSVADADECFLGAMARLADMANQQDRIINSMLLRELHYALLKGPQCSLLQDLNAAGSPGKQLFRAIEYLRGNLDRPVRISELSRAACMSESSLYRHFRALTSLSPLQYHKQLRLHEARRIMIAEHEQAATAAFRVGFESVSQFGREYKRLFGEAPGRDTKGKK